MDIGADNIPPRTHLIPYLTMRAGLENHINIEITPTVVNPNSGNSTTGDRSIFGPITLEQRNITNKSFYLPPLRRSGDNII